MTMLEAIIREFPVTDFSKDFKNMSNNRSTYTKEEVDSLIAEALAEAEAQTGAKTARQLCLGKTRNHRSFTI